MLILSESYTSVCVWKCTFVYLFLTTPVGTPVVSFLLILKSIRVYKHMDQQCMLKHIFCELSNILLVLSSMH